MVISLQTFLQPWYAQRFDWAQRNCCHFVAAWVRAREAFDPLAGLAPMPGTQRRVLRYAGRLGGLCKAWTKQMGRAPVRGELAQLGDVVLFALGAHHEVVGICNGRTALFLTRTHGIVALPMQGGAAQCVWAWRVGGGA